MKNLAILTRNRRRIIEIVKVKSEKGSFFSKDAEIGNNVLEDDPTCEPITKTERREVPELPEEKK